MAYKKTLATVLPNGNVAVETQGTLERGRMEDDMRETRAGWAGHHNVQAIEEAHNTMVIMFDGGKVLVYTWTL